LAGPGSVATVVVVVLDDVVVDVPFDLAAVVDVVVLDEVVVVLDEVDVVVLPLGTVVVVVVEVVVVVVGTGTGLPGTERRAGVTVALSIWR
jgi:hypothetical protein